MASPLVSALKTKTVLDREWVRKCFLLEVNVHNPEASVVRTQENNWLYFSEAQYNFRNTTLGGNFTINSLPQYTIFADIPAGGIASNTPMGKGRSVHTDYVGGMGRYYFESTDRWSQKVSFRFGVPEYKGLITFFTSFYDGGAAILGRTGRLSPGLFYLGAKIIGSVIALPYTLLIAANEAMRWVVNRPSTRYYNLKPAMPLYWQRVNLIAGMLAVNLGLYSANDKMGHDGNKKKLYDEINPDDYNSDLGSYNFKQIQAIYPELFNKTGGIDIYKVAGKAQRMQVIFQEYLKKATADGTIAFNNPQRSKEAMDRYLSTFRYSDKSSSIDEALKRYHDSRLGARTFKVNGEEVDPIGNDLLTTYVNKGMRESFEGAQGDTAALTEGGIATTAGTVSPGATATSTANTATTTAGGSTTTSTGSGVNLPSGWTAVQQGGKTKYRDINGNVHDKIPTASNDPSKPTRSSTSATSNSSKSQVKPEQKNDPNGFMASVSGLGAEWTGASGAAGKAVSGEKVVTLNEKNSSANSNAVNNTGTNIVGYSGTGTGQTIFADAKEQAVATTKEMAGNSVDENGVLLDNPAGTQKAPDSYFTPDEAAAALEQNSKLDNALWSILKAKDDGTDTERPMWERVQGWGKEWYEYAKRQGEDATDWVNFRVDAVKTVNESFQNQTAEPEIKSRINGISSSAQELRFSLSDFQSGFKALDTVIDTIRGTFMGLADGLHISGLAALMGGGFIDIPERWTSSSASWPTMSYTIKLRPVYGNVISRYLNMYIPLACILAGVLPISYGRHAHGAPFICEFYHQGRAQSRLAIIDSVSISRGEGNLGWTDTNDMLGCDITFNVKDLSGAMHAPIDSGMDDILNWRWLISDDTPFNDYMAALGNLSIAQMTYSTEKLKLNWHKYMVINSTYLSPGRLAMVAGDTMVGRVVRKLNWEGQNASIQRQ